MAGLPRQLFRYAALKVTGEVKGEEDADSINLRPSVEARVGVQW